MTMKNKEYKILIKNTDMHGEKYFEKTMLTLTEEKNKITYKFSTKLGDCVVQLENDTLFFERSGAGYLNFKLNMNEKNQFFYKTEFFENILFVECDKINFDKNSKNLEFNYRLFDSAENIINEITTFIKVM